MQSDWRDSSVGAVASLVTKGTTPTTLGHAFRDAGINFVKVESISPDGRFVREKLVHISPAAHAALSRSQLFAGDVLFTIAGTIGRTAIVSDDLLPANTNQAVAIIRPRTSLVMPRYLRFVLANPAFLRGALSRTVESVQANFSLGELKSAPMLLPPLGVQGAVVDILGALDDRIDLLRQTNATLDSVAQALFKSWFIDFDPVRAKAEGREPEGIDAATAALFPNDVRAWSNASPRVEAGVLVSRGILAIGDGYRAKNSELGTSGAPFVRAGDLLQGRITPTADHLLTASLSNARGKFALPGDTAFTSKGTIGRFAYVDDMAGDAVYSPQVCFWRSTSKTELSPVFLHFWMKSALFSEQVDKVKGQAAIMDFVSLSDQRRMLLDLPPPSVQRRFEECVAPILGRMSLNRASAAVLANTRDTLLPRLISGKLRLPEAAAQLEEAVA